MTEINEFEREFVIRTQALLRAYNGEYKLSHAINCMLGLIILPNEMLEYSHNEIWNKPIADIEQLNYLRLRFFEPIRRKTKDGIECYRKTFRILLKKVRNGIAHQNISPVNANGLFTGVLIRNYYSAGKRDMDLEIEFDRRELESFALFVAEKYLEE